MDKPLKDWTPGKYETYCVKQPGCQDSCPFYSQNRGCDLLTVDEPTEWDLPEPPRWTEQEREDANAILRLFCGAYTEISRRNAQEVTLVADFPYDYIFIAPKFFPSLKMGETVKLSEIAGCEDDG